jgi:hypothetical protein
MGTISDAITPAVQAAQRDFDKIRSNPNLTDAGKQQAIAKRYLTAKALVDQQTEAITSREAMTAEAAEVRVFSVRTLLGDQASLMISARDAADRVADMIDPQALATLLERAQRSGDEVLARAIIQRTIEIGPSVSFGASAEWDAIRQAFIAQYPRLADDVNLLWNRAWQGATTTVVSNLLDGWSTSSLKPRELSGFPEYQIQQIADAPEIVPG